MALSKNDVLAIGRGSLIDNSNAAVVFSSNVPVTSWSSLVTYAQYNVVEYNSTAYRSKIVSNTSNEPDTSPNDWEVLYSGVKSGDIAIIVNGSAPSITQRQDTPGVWTSSSSSPTVNPNNFDGASGATVLTFIGSSYQYAKISYLLTRGAGSSRQRKGTYNVLNDGIVSDVEYDHMFNDIGGDVDGWLTWTYSGANVELQVTAGLEGTILTFTWTLGGL